MAFFSLQCSGPVHGLPCVGELASEQEKKENNTSSSSNMLASDIPPYNKTTAAVSATDMTRFESFVKNNQTNNWCLPPEVKLFPQAMWSNAETVKMIRNATGSGNSGDRTNRTTTTNSTSTLIPVVVGGGLHFKGSGIGKPATRTRWAVYTNNDLRIEVDIRKTVEDPVRDPVVRLADVVLDTVYYLI